MRFERGNTSRKLRRRGGRGPYDDAQPESRGQRGCSYAGGSRASWNDDGCWAGRSAWWSRQFSSAGSGLPLVSVGLSSPRGRDSGDARPKWAQTSSKTKRTGAPSQRGESTHRVTHSFHSCGNRCGATPSTAVDDESYPQVVCHFAFRRLPRTHSCNYRRVIL